MFHLLFTKKVYHEPPDFIYLFTLVNACSIVRVLCVADGINIQPSWFQYPSDFIGKKFKFSRRKRHTIKHMGIAGIESFIIEWKRLSCIVAQRGNGLRESHRFCFVGNRLNTPPTIVSY